MKLEKLFTEKLEQLKNSTTSAVSMDLNEILGKDWKKVCVQGGYTLKDDFIRDTGESINYFEDITENELAIWVFYADGSIRTMILNRSVLDFLIHKSKNSNYSVNICTSIKYPTLYIYPKYIGFDNRWFHFKNEE